MADIRTNCQAPVLLKKGVGGSTRHRQSLMRLGTPRASAQSHYSGKVTGLGSTPYGKLGNVSIIHSVIPFPSLFCSFNETNKVMFLATHFPANSLTPVELSLLLLHVLVHNIVDP